LNASFQRLFERHYPGVRRFFLSRGFGFAECEDLAQETFLRAYKSLASFRGDASEKTWLLKIAKNIASNHLRDQGALKRKARLVPLEEPAEEGAPQEVADSESAAEPSEPLRELLAREEVRVLRGALQELPPQMRRCVMMRLHQDMKYREIAAALQLSIETVKSQLFQARQRLKEKLQDYFEEAAHWQ